MKDIRISNDAMSLNIRVFKDGVSIFVSPNKRMLVGYSHVIELTNPQIKELKRSLKDTKTPFRRPKPSKTYELI